MNSEFCSVIFPLITKPQVLTYLLETPPNPIMFHFCCLLLVIATGAAMQTEVDQARYAEGKRQFELVQQQSEMPQYGTCWKNAMTIIQTGCRRLSDTVQSRLALSYLNCFLQIQGREVYECSSDESVNECTAHMNDADRSSFTTFFTHTQNICYFLQAQVWHEETERTISRLAHKSSQVASELEASHKLQQSMLSTQNRSLHNQELLKDQAHNLSQVINASSSNVRSLFEELKRSTQEQRQIIGDVFDQLTKLQSTILGEVSGFYSFFYYFLSILVCYLLTSTSRTSGARVWLFIIMTVNVVLEQTLVRWLALLMFAEADNNNEGLYWLQKICRRTSMLLCLLVLIISAYLYEDINALNNALLVEIRKQNSDIRKFLAGNSALTLSADNTVQVTSTHNESSDSDYTSDGGEAEDSDAESDRTFVLEENKDKISDTESFLTIDGEAGDSDRLSLLEELNELRNSTPVRELGSRVQGWLDNEHYLEVTSSRDSLGGGKTPQTTAASPSTPYNLRPRRRAQTQNTSPALSVESAKSFSKTVQQLQEISEKNSRLVRVFQQQHQVLSPSQPSQSRENQEGNKFVDRVQRVELSRSNLPHAVEDNVSVVFRASRSSSRSKN